MSRGSLAKSGNPVIPRRGQPFRAPFAADCGRYSTVSPGIHLAKALGMPSTLGARRPADPSNVLRWTFLREGTALTCQVIARNLSSYDVRIVPMGDVSAACVETLGTVGLALRRHAEIAKGLRESGWQVVGRTAVTQAQ
jgi:hypothetical protein